MDLRDLKMFLHLAESRHFGRSARAMHVSPSTLSRQIQRLEEDLGQPLFVRDNRTVTLTEAGEELRIFAQQTLLQYQQLRHTIDQQGPSLSGELHIFCSVTAAYSHLPPFSTASARNIRRLKLSSPPAMPPTRWKKWLRAKRIWRLPENLKRCRGRWRSRCWRIWR